MHVKMQQNPHLKFKLYYVCALSGSMVVLMAVGAAFVIVQRRSRALSAGGKELNKCSAVLCEMDGVPEGGVAAMNPLSSPSMDVKHGRSLSPTGGSSLVKHALNTFLGGSIPNSVVPIQIMTGTVGFDQELQCEYQLLRSMAIASAS